MTPPYNILFLCTGNSARSIISEALCNDMGGAQWRGYSAGSHPSAHPHTDALAHLSKMGHDTHKYRSKSWDEFSAEGAPQMDIVVTVCDNAANEVCPVFHGQHIKLYWPAPDPAYVEPLSARQAAFAKTYKVFRARITALQAMDMDRVSRADMQEIADKFSA
ncbi:arsenate reductase ArsC [Robiginitomaculum antarcticum]|uniref:arsenate reductase ArsC n=1 Tax=Robiginitomaculum antarcticum TaxID=437507 RepID=UPI00037EB0B8|nr:arsenate reductase ArsC [Robiginitomaculum antarcticum]